jgi:hypothetical protein
MYKPFQYLRKFGQGNSIRREFLLGGLEAVVAGIGTNLAPWTEANAKVKYYSDIPVLNVTADNYREYIQKNIVEPMKDAIIIYYNDALMPKLIREQEEKGEDTIRNFQNWEGYLYNNINRRIPVYRIEMKDWPKEAVHDWADNINQRRKIPSIHVYIDGKLEARMWGIPSSGDLNSATRKFDALLNSKGR